MCRFVLCLMAAIVAPAPLLAQQGIWSNYLNVSNNSGTSYRQDLCVDRFGFAHLIWEDNTAFGGLLRDILYSRFNGSDWSTQELVSFPYPNSSWMPRLDLDSLDLPHVVWEGNSMANGIIYYAYRDSLLGWTAPLGLSSSAAASSFADIAVDDMDNLHVVWVGAVPQGSHIFYRCYDGSQWLPIEDLNPQHVGGAGYPRIVADSQDRVHLVYSEESTSWNIRYRYHDSGGWSQPIDISNINDQNSTLPDLALDQWHNPHVIWKQLLPYIQGEIFYSYFDGLIWSMPLNISNFGGWCSYPTLAISPAMKCVAFNLAPPSTSAGLEFIYATDDIWSSPETLFVNPINSLCLAAMDFDTSDHLQIVSAPPMSPGGSELLHQIYVNSQQQLPAIILPHSTPIIIPSTGGRFAYDLRIENQVALPVTFDAWIELARPDSSIYGPIMLRKNLSLPSNGAIIRSNLVQNVPGNAPQGQYFYYLRAGDYPDSVVVSGDSFAFVKEGITLSAEGEWFLDGWEGDSLRDGTLQLRSSILHSSSPNPFNAVTVASFELPVASHVSSQVYETAGRLVATLVNGWRQAGRHEVTFDGSDLASGVYIYRLQAGDISAAGKMVLLK